MDNTAIEIGQAIGGYAALIAAVVAAVAAWLTYRLRPLRMRSIEAHSEELKKTITDWIDHLTDPASPSRPAFIPLGHSYIEQVPDPEPYTMSLENDILFRDLRNHLPSSLFDKWDKYKSRQNAYLKDKQYLTQEILQFVTRTTGLKVHDASGPLPGETVLLHPVLDALFDDFYSISQGREPSCFVSDCTELTFDREHLWIGSRAIISCPLKERHTNVSQEATCRDLCAKLSQAVGGEEGRALVADMKQLQALFNCLSQLREGLTADLREWLKVPILPNECSLLKKGQL